MLQKIYDQITITSFLRLKLFVGFHTRDKIEAMSDVNLVVAVIIILQDCYHAIAVTILWTRNSLLTIVIRRGQRKTQTSDVGFWNTNTIFINQNVKFKEVCGSLGNLGSEKVRMQPEQEHSPSHLILDN